MAIKKLKANGHIVQADWSQTDPKKMDYIHNKPIAVDKLNKYLTDTKKTVCTNLSYTDSMEDFIVENINIVLQANVKYIFEIVNTDTNNTKCFETTSAISTASDNIININFAQGPTDADYLEIRQTNFGDKGYSIGIYNGGIFELNISSNSKASQLLLNLMPAKIASSDYKTQYNYIITNYIVNIYEYSGIDLDIEIGAQVNTIDTVSDEFDITNKHLALNNNTIGSQHLKADSTYTGDDAEIWIFNCGNSKF
jgi:hypothetical protein